MTKAEIRDLVVEAVVNTEELTKVVNTIFKEIGDAYNKGFNQGKYDPDFDNYNDDND
jgi:nucleoid DNA-binding protein